MGFLGELIGAGKTGGSKLASRFGRAARVSRKASRMGGKAATASGLPIPPAANTQNLFNPPPPGARRAKSLPPTVPGGNPARPSSQAPGRWVRARGPMGGSVVMRGSPVPKRVASPKVVNKKGASGFSHGKKLAYGAAGVGAMGLAWGVTQRNKSTDSSGYRQSRGMYNY